MKKEIPLSVIVEAIEETTNGWQQYYNVITGEIESIPDSDNDYADMDEFEEIYEEIDTSGDYVRLPSQYDLHEYGIMEDFADDRDDEELSRALHGRKPFRSFKDTAKSQGTVDEYYAFRTSAYTDIAREWCEENEIPFIDDEKG